MRSCLNLESPSRLTRSYRQVSAFSRGIRAVLLATVVMIGLAVTAKPAAADPISEQQLDAMFAWVVNQEAAEVAYANTAWVLDAGLRLTLREYLLLRTWIEGGDPWALDPNWEAPTGP